MKKSVLLSLCALLALALPHGAWAANDDPETIYIDGTSFYILRNNSDWLKFRDLVDKAKGNSDVNAILDEDFTIGNSIALEDGVYYRGIFDGNGHTLNVDITGGSLSFIAPFSKVKAATFRNLHVTGSVKAGIHAAGLIGMIEGSSEVHIDKVWVSADITTTSDRLGGFVGHTQDANLFINDCRFDGTLNSSQGGTYGGAFAGWGHNGRWYFHRNYENGTYNGIAHAGFSYWYNNAGDKNTNTWGTNSRSTNCISSHNWGEMANNNCKNVTDQSKVIEMMNGEVAGSWQMVDGKAVPTMVLFPNEEQATVDTYDMIPGVEAGEEGTVKLPVSSNVSIRWIEATYTDEYGLTKKVNRVTLPKNSYSGYLMLPATEAHRDLNVTVKLMAGSVTKTIKNTDDVVIHNPRMLKGDLMAFTPKSETNKGQLITDAGAIKLEWSVKDLTANDLLDGDQFLIQRTLTGKPEDYQNIGSVDYDSKQETYEFKDSLFTNNLSEELIDKAIGIPLVRYRVFRSSTSQLWGMDKNPTAAYVQPQMATLLLLEPTAAKAAWSDETERKVKVEWSYKPNDNSHNYVWDSRAAMKLEIQAFRRDGSKADSIVTTLTEEQLADCSAEIQLTRSCVTYRMRLIVDGSKSPIGQGTSEIFAVLNSREDFESFANKIHNADIHSNLTAVRNAIMTNDISLGSDIGNYWLGYTYNDSGKPFTGNLNGNGHILTISFPANGEKYVPNLAPICHAANGAVICNLTTNGHITPQQKFAAGIVGQVDEGNVFIENCSSKMYLLSELSGDGSHGGLVGIVSKGGNLRISNCLFGGGFTYYYKGLNTWYCGGFIGWREATPTIISNSYFNPKELTIISSYRDRNNTFVRSRDNDVVLGLLEDCLYKESFGLVQGKQSDTAPDNRCWKNGAPAVEQKSFTTPVSGSVADVAMPDGQFFYENLGHIDPQSLDIQPLQSSVVLTWNNLTDDAVDYYEVWRRDSLSTDTVCLISQLTEMQYEDKTTSPVHKYYYFVRGVNSCEGTTYDDTEWGLGHCVQTGTVEGYLRFADGTGIQGETINITSKDGTVQVSVTTDESGYFFKSGLPYINETETSYSAMPGLNGYTKGAIPVTFGTLPGENTVKGVIFVVEKSIKFSGYVQYDGTSIPVQGVSFLVDGHEVHNGAGKVVTDHEGKYAFRMLEGEHTIQAVKDGHVFYQKGFYHEDKDTVNVKYYFNIDKAGIYFYDQTRVKLIGRVAGGKDQGAIPLGNSLSRNNLGDDLKMVLSLEGDNASRLVWDILDSKKTTRDEVFRHKAHDQKHEYQTKVHTTLHRMEVTPDVNTGEYEVLLPPVKWKIQQITAKGYATLFQDGQTGDVIDLTDSIKPHTDHYEGLWKNANGDDVKSVDVSYHAKYSRIYHSPVIIDYKQAVYDKFEYFGDHYYWAKDLAGNREQVTLAYGKRKKDWPEGRKDSLEAVYTFGHPVFSVERSYPFKISATEKYYYNNDIKNDTVDIVRLSGGKVIIHNGMESSTHRDSVLLDSVGEATYAIKAKQTPYMLTGDDALRTISMTLLLDGTYYEATPLRAYVLNIATKPGAKDVLPIKQPQLIDILRDPPGGGSSAKLSKGSMLKYSYTLDMQAKVGLSFSFQWGAESSFYVGFVGIGAETGTINGAKNKLGFNIDLVATFMEKNAYSYTITCNEDISTSSDKTMVGADADVYIGTETNLILKPALAIRAIPHSMWKQQQGAVMAGSSLEIARGYDAKGDTIHLVRDEVVTYSPEISSVFQHSQKYIIDQLIPDLEAQCKSQLFTGSKEDAQKQADASGKPVYWSMLKPEDENFGMMNYKVTKSGGKTTLEPVYYTNKMEKAPEGNLYYQIILPKDYTGKKEDRIADFCQSLQWWMGAISQNEQEKLGASELVKNFDIDGASGLTYSEDFSSDITSSAYMKFPWSNIGNVAVGLASVVTNAIAKAFSSASGGKTDDSSSAIIDTDVHLGVTGFKLGITPVMSLDINGTYGNEKKYNRKESFTISMDKRSHLDFDVYRVNSDLSKGTTSGDYDIFVEGNIDKQATEVINAIKNGMYPDNYKNREWRYSRGFVYRTRGGATCRPYEGERKTVIYNPGTLLDERTKKIENPIIKMDKQSVSGVPYDQPARFKLYLTNDSEVPEAAYSFFDLYLDETSNPKGAKIMMDGMPLSGNPSTVQINPGQVTEKTIEVWASEDFDYENLRLTLLSQGDAKTLQSVSFDVHYLQTAGDIAISTPGDKWIMNTDAAYEEGKGWYMPVIISGFNKNQKNFDHIEFQYKESTRGDDYWTNLCGYYNDSTIYAAASGTKAMIPENGNIITRFFGEGTIMEKAYDLRAVLFCRNGNGFLTNSSKVLSGVKDTRRPQLFGTPEPKDGILGAGDNIVFNFSEDIEYNYLQETTNFEVKGETNETSIQEAPSLQFLGKGYAQSEARRNFADKSMTVEVMIKPDDVDEDMPIFSHGRDGKQLQLWLTKDKRLKAVVDDKELVSDTVISFKGFQRVALVLDNEHKKLLLYSKYLNATLDSVAYSGYGPLIFGSTQQTDVNKRSHYKGRMLQARVWNRAMDNILLDTYGNQMLTGYEMGLTDYYPMNEGKGDYATDLAQGAHLTLYGASWAQPRGMSIYLDKEEQRDVKGLRLKEQFFQRNQEQDYTLMFWFKTNSSGHGTLLCNGSGRNTDVEAADKFFIGFEGQTLKYRSNGQEFPLGDGFDDDEWHHYAMTVNRAHQVATIYVDNNMKAQFTTDSLGGMTGKFYLGNMVWQDAGASNDVVHQDNPLTGYIDGITVFEQALPISLIKRYTDKAIGGSEKGLITYVGFDRQERQKNGDITLQPYVLNKKIQYDPDGNPTEEHDSVFADPIADITKRVSQNVSAPMQAYEELRNLNFSFVGRDHQLLVNIDELDSRINKRTVYVTVNNIPDLNGNYTASPSTKAVFIDRNPLRWAQKTYKSTLNPEYYNDQFEINIANNSGASHTYKIERLPKWLSVNKQTDVIEPLNEQTLTFTISKDINTGTYDEIIYLVDENNLIEPLALNITVEGAEPDWMVEDKMMQFSMNIVARVQIGDDIVTDSRDIVGVFDNLGRCMGVGNVNYDPVSSESLVYLTVCDSMTTSSVLNFKLWHYETGKMMVLKPSMEVKFQPETFAGSTKSPIILKAYDQYIQSIQLWPGWNWVSLNVINYDYYYVKDLLEMFAWKEGDMLSDETRNISLLYQDGQWITNKGSKQLDDLHLNIGHSYRIKVSGQTMIELSGTAVKTKGDRTITVQNGWNSIGYTPLVNLPIETALADYLEEAKDGDVVKNKTSFAMFSEGANKSRGWKGNLQYMKPGEGYMLYRQGKETVTFTYPFYEAKATFFDEASSTNRAPMAENYADNMVMTAAAEGIELEPGDRLIAIADGAIVGETELQTLDSKNLFFMTIAGEKTTPVSFAIERAGDIIASTNDVLNFQKNGISGTPELPTAISFVQREILPQNGWYTLQGFKLDKRPTQRGVYIMNGKKIIIK